MTRPFQTFLTNRVFQPNVPSDMPLNRGQFAIDVTLHGEQFRFNFVWVGRKQFFLMDVFRQPNGERVDQIVPRVGDLVRVDGLFRSNQNYHRPDAIVEFEDVEGSAATITPQTINDGDHKLTIRSGKWVVR